MGKDFNKWNALKMKIDDGSSKKQFKEREIWWTSIGLNIGFEQDGKNDQFHRPVLVLKKFNADMFFGVALTSKDKEGFYYSNFEFIKRGDKEYTKSAAILSQVRLFSSKRLIRRIVKLNETTYDKIQLDVIKVLTQKKRTP